MKLVTKKEKRNKMESEITSLEFHVCSDCLNFFHGSDLIPTHDTAIFESFRRKKTLNELSENGFSFLGDGNSATYFDDCDCEMCGQFKGLRHVIFFRKVLNK